MQYIKRIMTWLEGRKRPMNRAAKLAKTRIAEGLEKRPEEMALCVQSSEPLKCGGHSLEFRLWGRKRQLWTVVRRSQKRRRCRRWVSFHIGGDDAWTVLAGLASQASDLFSHSGPPPEEGVLCSVCTSRNS